VKEMDNPELHNYSNYFRDLPNNLDPESDSFFHNMDTIQYSKQKEEKICPVVLTKYDKKAK
jgi:hypothetical protein